MTSSWILAATEPSPWIGPAIVAAAVSGLVALVTIGLNARQARMERQRQVFADAFAACQLYKEFPYRVRRRRSGKADADADRTRLTTELSDVQARLNDYKARLRVEAPRVGDAFVHLVAETRRIAGAEVRRSWDLPPTDGDAVSIQDIDLSAIGPAEDCFLRAVAGHLSVWPAPVAESLVGRRARGTGSSPAS